jgi:hypothetical protein
MVIKQVGSPEFPIGMLSMVPILNCAVSGNFCDLGFCWYLSDAPAEAYRQVLKIPPIKGVAAALIDCSIQATLDVSGDRTHLLHADPNGGDKLISFYKGCNMTQLPATHPQDPAPDARRSLEQGCGTFARC